MFMRYKKTSIGEDAFKYEWQEEISLFGCNNGYIPWLLENKLPKQHEMPYKWYIDVADEVDAAAEWDNDPKYKNSALVIDLKPHQKESKFSLYELVDVWGFSDETWSPLMLRLSGLFVDEDPKKFDQKCFTRKSGEIDDPIYEFLYTNGGIEKDAAALTGKWTLPPVSPTNAALLWPEVLSYFVSCIRKKTPQVLEKVLEMK